MRDPKTEALRRLAAARGDLAYARHAASGGHHAPACFHCQQAAEKAVKAVHYLRGARVVLGHTVRALIQSLDPRSDSLDALLDAARELDLFYVPTRCPNGLDEGTPGQAFSAAHSSHALELAARIVDTAVAAAG
jgi:HEPN domain-containing protein